MNTQIKILKVKSTGNGKCISEQDHKWIVNPHGKMTLTFPPKFINERICEVCGRKEEVQRSSLVKGDYERFEECVKKFRMEE